MSNKQIRQREAPTKENEERGNENERERGREGDHLGVVLSLETIDNGA
jgi:hypothetical protein